MKERNRRGQFRATETHNYKKKMKDHFGTFTSESEEAFNEAALDKYDFAGTGKPCGGSHIAADKTCKLGAGGGGAASGGDAKAAKGGGASGGGGGGGSDKAAKAEAKAARAEAKAAKDAKAAVKVEKDIKSTKGKLKLEANTLKQMRDSGVTDSRINSASARVRGEKMKLESLRNKQAKLKGESRTEKSTMTSRIAKEERDIKRQASKGNEKSQKYVDLQKRIRDGNVKDPYSARQQLSALRSELKPASPNQ